MIDSSIFTLPERTVLIPEAPINAGTAERESLASLFRATCEKNQLSMRAVLKGLHFHGVSSYLAEISSEYPLYASGHGAKITRDITNIIEALTGLGEISSLSFAFWNSQSPAKPIIAIDSYRKWCPRCYHDDVQSGQRPHDRLIWAAQGVELCTIHAVKLESICGKCGKGRFSFLLNNDVAGFCPHCLNWLGGSARNFPLDHDDDVRYRWWIARCVAEILNSDFLSDVNFHANLATSIDALINRHFNNGTEAGLHLGRAKSVISEWRNGVVSPHWLALCEVSFAFQTSIRSMLVADKDAILFSSLVQLPSSVLHGKPPTKKRQAIDWKSVERYIEEVVAGRHPKITRLNHIGQHFGFERTAVAKKFPELANLLRPLLAKRRESEQVHRNRGRELALIEATNSAAKKLVREGEKITRRSIIQALEYQGVKPRRPDFKKILAVAKQSEHDLSTKFLAT